MEFKIYQNLVEKYYKNDCRELNFQNRILIPFLELLIDGKYDVVDTSTLYKNWKNIYRDSFAGQYTPDILIVKDWNLFEKKQKPQIILEAKSPTAIDRAHADKEVEEYIDKSQYVILTDCITWEIYEKNKKTIVINLDEAKQKVCERSIPKTKEERMIKWIDNGWDLLHSTIKAII